MSTSRKDMILRCILACIQNSPPPEDIDAVHVQPMSTKMGQTKYENIAAYIDQQLTLHEDR